ncbi:uncharacterized protein [Halyomorpha halys]|uniref:uncharacterized protein n=1 Tax=Halyomorpha halys TaxID=286706 RepID=UPI0006D4CD81|nr:uncharacterized protein LOC106690247 [Halyomorpha halys]
MDNQASEGSIAYVEFENSFFPFISFFSHAQIEYELVGSGGKSFQILATGKPRQLEVIYNNLEIDGHPKGMRHSLGWKHKGENNFIIIGRNGTYTGNSMNASNWMEYNMESLGGRTLRQISIPGSHTAGMSKLDGHSTYGKPCNVLTQSYSVGEQLNLGIRYLDIRPVINDGKYLTGKYSLIQGSWQGGNGQSIASIINDLNVFTKEHNELIVIKLSYSLNTDNGSDNYRRFNQTEWENLFQQLDTINHLYNNPNKDVQLDQITLSCYTNHGSRSSVFIIVDDPDSKVELGSRLGNGYFMPDNLNIYDENSHTNKVSDMIDDQIWKMSDYSHRQYFLLSWTLTPSTLQFFKCKPTVKDLADEVNIQLGWLLYRKVCFLAFPNIILVDNVKDTDVVSMSLALTFKIMFK